MNNRRWVKITAIILAVLMAGSGLSAGIFALFCKLKKQAGVISTGFLPHRRLQNQTELFGGSAGPESN